MTTMVGIQHVDLCVSDVERSLAFYLGVLGPAGMKIDVRVPSFRGTEEILYLRFGDDDLGLRPADGGAHRPYEVGIEHLAFEVPTREDVNRAFERAVGLGARVHSPPDEDKHIREYYACFVFDPDGIRVEVFCAPAATGDESRWATAPPPASR